MNHAEFAHILRHYIASHRCGLAEATARLSEAANASADQWIANGWDAQYTAVGKLRSAATKLATLATTFDSQGV